MVPIFGHPVGMHVSISSRMNMQDQKMTDQIYQSLTDMTGKSGPLAAFKHRIANATFSS